MRGGAAAKSAALLAVLLLAQAVRPPTGLSITREAAAAPAVRELLSAYAWQAATPSALDSLVVTGSVDASQVLVTLSIPGRPEERIGWNPGESILVLSSRAQEVIARLFPSVFTPFRSLVSGEGQETLFWEGFFAAREGNRELALSRLKEATRLDASFARALHHLMIVMAEQKFTREEMIGDLDRAVKLAGGRDPGLLATAAGWYLVLGEKERARAALGSYRSGNYPLSPVVLTNVALTLPVEEGVATLRKALLLDPAFAPAVLNLSRILLAEGRGGEVATLLEGGEERAFPALAFLYLGRAYIALGRLEEAEGVVGRGIARHPANAPLLSLGVRIALLRGDMGKAKGRVGAWRALTGVTPENLLLEGFIDWKAGRRTEAERTFSKISGDPGWESARDYILGLLELSAGEKAAAAKHLLSAFSLDPREGWVLSLGLGNVQQAVKKARGDVAARPLDPSALTGLGLTLLASGDFRGGAALFRRSLAAKADQPVLAAFVDRLERLIEE